MTHGKFLPWHTSVHFFVAVPDEITQNKLSAGLSANMTYLPSWKFHVLLLIYRHVKNDNIII